MSKEVRVDVKKIKSIVFKNVILVEILNVIFDKYY